MTPRPSIEPLMPRMGWGEVWRLSRGPARASGARGALCGLRELGGVLQAREPGARAAGDAAFSCVFGAVSGLECIEKPCEIHANLRTALEKTPRRQVLFAPSVRTPCLILNAMDDPLTVPGNAFKTMPGQADGPSFAEMVAESSCGLLLMAPSGGR